MEKNQTTRKKCTVSKEKIVDMYNLGNSTLEIASLANVSDRYIRTVLKEKNVIMQPNGSWKRKFHVNEAFFRTWSSSMAYILGFFFADGCIIRNQQSISFAQKEKYILEIIKESLDSNHPIIQNKETKVYILNIHSKIMKNDLISIHGLTPNKSKDIKFPEVPETYLSHFIRGFFDGDGYVNYKSYFVSFVGGSFSFMDSLKLNLETVGFETNFTEHENCFRVYISGRKSISQFAEWLYKDSSIHLERKYKEFQKEKLHSNLLQNKIKTHKNALEKRRRDNI